jgi:hypothetical protein
MNPAERSLPPVYAIPNWNHLRGVLRILDQVPCDAGARIDVRSCRHDAYSGNVPISAARRSEPGTRTGRPGLGLGLSIASAPPTSPEGIGLLLNGARLSRGRPRLLLLCFFLRLLRDRALYDLGPWLVRGTSRKHVGCAGGYPRRICICHDCLGRRPIAGETGIGRDVRLHQPVETEEKGCAGSKANSEGGADPPLLESRGAGPKHMRT